MSTLFISDLHLSAGDPARIKLAVDFLSTPTQHLDALYILGDLFDSWLGDDIIPTEFDPFIEQLQRLHQLGTKSYLMVGNRDFMIGKRFAHHAGCELLGDVCIIDLYGCKTLLMHGDTLCIDDTKYQRYRRWSRNRLLQWCFLHLSARYRQGVADKIKQQSRHQKQYKSTIIMDVNLLEVKRVMRQFGVTQLIHGHTHRPAIHHFKIDDKTACRMVLGDWHDQASYLKCDDKQCQLVDHRITDC